MLIFPILNLACYFKLITISLTCLRLCNQYFQVSYNLKILLCMAKITQYTFTEPLSNRPLSHGGHFESQGNKKLSFCLSSLALDERLDVQNLTFQHCLIKVYFKRFFPSGVVCLALLNSRISISQTLPMFRVTRQ